MQAFHNNQKIKDKYLARVIDHQKADEPGGKVSSMLLNAEKQLEGK